MTQNKSAGELPYEKENPSFYCGDELHEAKQEKIHKFMEQAGFDALLFVRSEVVRYITDFFIKGYRPFFELEYFVIVPKNGSPIVGHTSGSDNYRIQLRSFIEDHRKLPGLSNWHKEIIKIFKDYGITSGRVGTDILPFHVYEKVKAELPNLEFVDANELLDGNDNHQASQRN